MLDHAWSALDGDPDDLQRVTSTADTIRTYLPSPLAVGTLVHDAVAAASLAAGLLSEDAGGPPITVELDPARVATAVSSERYFTINGDQPPVWAELSGYWPTEDGWLRTHANYPHHRARLITALGLADASADELRRALWSLGADEAAELITAQGGIAVGVRTEDEWRSSAHGIAAAHEPLIVLERRADGEAQPTRILDSERPLAGVRVLDLTRVIAGPVATRTLALFGADVLRIDSPLLPEIAFQHLDTGADKQSTILDLASDRDVLDELLLTADIVVSGYRPGALERFGLDADSLAERGIIPATLSAWGTGGPWSGRRGFDSIVQAASGIAWLSSKDGSAPGALPAQALDHSAGYLLAAGIMTSLRRRREDGTIWSVRTSLARMAVELLDLPRAAARPATDVAESTEDPLFEATTVESETDAGVISYAAPAPAYSGSPTEWLRAPVSWGSSPVAW